MAGSVDKIVGQTIKVRHSQTLPDDDKMIFTAEYDYPLNIDPSTEANPGSIKLDSNETIENENQFQASATEKMKAIMEFRYDRLQETDEILQVSLGLQKDEDGEYIPFTPEGKPENVFIDADKAIRRLLQLVIDFEAFKDIKEELIHSHDKAQAFEKFRSAKRIMLGYESIERYTEDKNFTELTVSQDLLQYGAFITAIQCLLKYMTSFDGYITGLDREHVITFDDEASIEISNYQQFREARTKFMKDPLSPRKEGRLLDYFTHRASQERDYFDSFRHSAINCIPATDRDNLLKNPEKRTTFRKQKFLNIDCLNARKFIAEKQNEEYVEKRDALKVTVLETFDRYKQTARATFMNYVGQIKCKKTTSITLSEIRVIEHEIENEDHEQS